MSNYKFYKQFFCLDILFYFWKSYAILYNYLIDEENFNKNRAFC